MCSPAPRCRACGRIPGFPLEHVIETLYYSSSGIYGSLTGTSATFIAMFILFGALLEVTGGGKTFMDFALWAAGRMKGGPAQVCVAASAGFGMISGSAVANVSVTGNYTIPLMRRLGYHPNFAGGVESMSSVGGSLSPPIMGIASFIMADLLAVPYIEVMKYAIIPCVLFYTGIVAGIHFEAQRIGLAPHAEAGNPAAARHLHLGQHRAARHPGGRADGPAVRGLHAAVVGVLRLPGGDGLARVFSSSVESDESARTPSRRCRMAASPSRRSRRC